MSKYICDKCNYETNRKNDWLKHQETKKHKCKEENDNDNCVENENCKCDCGKEFKYQRSFVRHQKTCKFIHLKKEKSDLDDVSNQTSLCTDLVETKSKSSAEQLSAELLVQLIKQNEELRNMIAEQHSVLMEQQKNMLIHQNNITTQQAQIMELCKHPKTIKNNFNLNFFLNVQCKDALNISEFVNNLAIKISDIENVGRLGYVEGVSRIILDALQQLDLYKRPIHCTDLKREVLFVKDEDKWDKDNNNVKIKKAISHVAQKNCRTLCKHITPNMMMAEHPDCEKNLIMMKNVNGGDSATREKNHEKIVSIISKNVIVEQQNV